MRDDDSLPCCFSVCRHRAFDDIFQPGVAGTKKELNADVADVPHFLPKNVT